MVVASGNTLEITGPGDPWTSGVGTYDPATCMGTLVTTGTIAGFMNIECTYTVTLGPGGTIVSGTYACGTGGQLPGGCPITWTLAPT